MSQRPVYLAKSRYSPVQRAHFGIFIPNNAGTSDSSKDFRSKPCPGTIIHVVGEPLMIGYAIEFKRNYDCSTSHDLRQLVLLGCLDVKTVSHPKDNIATRDNVPSSTLEHEATMVAPPTKGQDVRKPIDGVTTKRCQEWTMEYLQRLVAKGHLPASAITVAQRERDPANHGIFGQGGPAP